MIECSKDFRLALEPGDALGIGSHGRRQHFDGYRPFQVRVSGLVDLTHPAGANGGQDLVRPEARSTIEGQFVGIIRARWAA
jgi:hypothetical protein